MRMMKICIAMLLIQGMTACTWVELSEQGEHVRVLTAAEITSCKRVGKTTVKTAEKVAGLERHEHKIQEESDTLARNSAVELEGDAVVPVGKPVNGRQVYEVYRCRPE